MNSLNIFIFEITHFKRNKFKVIATVLFVLASIYALQNGLNLYQKNIDEIEKITINKDKSNSKVLDWFDKGKKGPEDRNWVDISTPFWAVYYASTNAIKKPLPIMPFSIGQAEQFGYYKQVTTWSTVYDADLSEEIANPERLTIGTLDFGFVFLCLFPLLLIILVFNIGGIERDLSFIKLLELQTITIKKWLFVRFSFYFVFSILLLFAIIFPYSLYTKAPFSLAFNYFLVCVLYTFLWFIVFYCIALFGKSSADQALKMIGVWLLFCVLIPGTIHQVTNLKYSADFMTDYLDASRKETYALYDLKPDTIKKIVVNQYPELKNTAFGRDTIMNTNIINNTSAAVVNVLMKNAALKLSKKNEKRNDFIKSTYAINPFGFFQNKLNAICGTDYYAFQKYRSEIQLMIDKKIKTMLLSDWNQEVITKEKYQNYIKTFEDVNQK